MLALHRRYPDIELRLTVSDSSNLEDSLHAGLIDIALIQKPQFDDIFDCHSFSPIPTGRIQVRSATLSRLS
ncbi:LysR substrate-binding domain-containing protein [Erwinia sp. V71]|uniref:LysR substrate-binding domain-containing protein n=1 Tax=Erwinia sp. V71 TaxID=3369424 RepID=UPI003F62077A